MFKSALLILIALSSFSVNGTNLKRQFQLDIIDISVFKIKNYSIVSNTGSVSCSPTEGSFNSDTHRSGTISCVDTQYSPDHSIRIYYNGLCSLVTMSDLYEKKQDVNTCYLVSSAKYYGKLIITCNENYRSC